MKKIVLIVLLTVLITGCSKHFTGPGPQPHYFEDQGHEDMLNVFGVLRPGSEYGKPLSFIHVENVVSVTPFQSGDISPHEIIDADLTLFYNDNDTLVFSYTRYTNFGSVFNKEEYRHPTFYPHAGKTYRITCKKEGFPVVTAETTMPFAPRIKDLTVSFTKLSFTIIRDESASLYDIFFEVGEEKFTTRVLRGDSGDIPVEMDLEPGIAREGKLFIYAYDKNLSEYLSHIIILKPNTFQPTYSTVSNGYGCIGSMNSCGTFGTPSLRVIGLVSRCGLCT